MDTLQIILTIAACLAGLFILWAIVAGIIAAIAKKSFDKSVEKMRSDFHRPL